MKCQDFRELIDSYLSDELLTETNHDVLRHLEECADCRHETKMRRDLLLRLRFAVKNSPQFQIRDEFSRNLRAQLKQSTGAKKAFWSMPNAWIAVAAVFVLTLGLGFWFVQKNKLPATEVARTTQNPQSVFLENVALRDHQNCAVKYNLAEVPVEIDLASAKFAGVRQAVLLPLQSAADKYELVESHICKYDGQVFTHIVFEHRGKTVSVLLTDLRNYQALKNEEIVKLAASGYQLAHFDTKNKAVFVVSDLPPQENAATAEILINPVRQHLNDSELTKLALLTKLK